MGKKLVEVSFFRFSFFVFFFLSFSKGKKNLILTVFESWYATVLTRPCVTVMLGQAMAGSGAT